MRGPSIKGIVIAAVAEHVVRLVEAGKIASEQLEARLEKEDLELLDAKIQPALWYSIYSFQRLISLMADGEAGGDRDGYLRLNGYILAKRMRKLSLYSQLERTDASDEQAPGGLSFRRIKLTLSLWHAMVNFSRWQCQMESDDPPVFRIDVDEAEHYVPVLRVANAGFLEGVFGQLANAPVRVEIDEDRRDHFVYRLRLQSG